MGVRNVVFLTFHHAIESETKETSYYSDMFDVQMLVDTILLTQKIKVDGKMTDLTTGICSFTMLQLWTLVLYVKFGYIQAMDVNYFRSTLGTGSTYPRHLTLDRNMLVGAGYELRSIGHMVCSWRAEASYHMWED